MSVFEYDKALVVHLRKIFQSSNVHISEPEDIFDTQALYKNDQIKLPLINLSRTGYHMISERENSFALHSGFTAELDIEKKLSSRVQTIPIGINYQLDIYTRTRAENDSIVRELLFYFKIHPTLIVHVNYNSIEYRHNFNLFFDPEIEDNSDIASHKNSGEIFRQTLGMYTDDAYLWKMNIARTASISIEDLSITLSEEKGE